MKSSQIITAGLLALACVSTTFAETVKVTGSTAFRKSLYAGIIAKLGGPAAVKVAYVASAAGLGSANQATFTNGTDVVQCCMAGSVGGVKWETTGTADAPTNTKTFASTDAANTLTAKAWIAVPAGTFASLPWVAPTVGAAPGYTLGGGTYLGTQSGVALSTWGAAAIADVSMSDSYQSSTAFDSGTTGVTLDDAGGSDVGVVTFIFAKGTQSGGVPVASYNRLTNISPLGFQYLAANGFAKLSLFTGDVNDAAYDVVLIGRDNDSGTRLATNFETGYGNVDTSMSQWFAQDATNQDVGTVSAAASIDHLAPSNGVVGYSSGGSVKNVLNKTQLATAKRAGRAFIPVGYLGKGDAPAASQILTYNGVLESDVAVQNGSYTFWTNEHMYYDSAYITPARAAIADLIAAQMRTTYAPAALGVLSATMNVNRIGEGTVVNPN